MTAASRDSPDGKVPSQTPASYGSLCDQRFIRLSKACWRLFPSGNDATHLLAASGSPPAHCHAIAAAAVACASGVDNRETSFAASRGSDSAMIEITLGKTESRTAASGRFPAQVSA